MIRPAAGGIKEHLTHLRNGLKEEYEIIICGPADLAEWAEGFQFYPIDIVDGINLRKDLKAIWQLKSVLRAAKPRLVHIHGLKSVMIGVPAAKLSGGSRLLFTAHNCLPQPQSRWYGVTHGYRRVEGYTRSEALAAMGLKADHFIIGVVARLIPEKGITCLLQAAALLQHILPQVRFVIVGDGPMRGQLEQYARALQLQEHVKFLGFRRDVPLLMAGWDLFVLPSFSEGLSVSVLEAMAAKLPLVVSDIPSMREVVVPGKSGLFFTPNDVPGLAAAILQIAKDPSKQQRMGDYNYRTVVRYFGIDQMIKATKLQYQELIEEGTVW